MPNIDTELASKIKELYLNGVRIDDIAKLVGLNRSYLSVYIRVLGLPPKKEGKVKLTDEKVKKILDLRSQGCTVKAIADEVGLSTDYVKRVLYAFGLRLKKKISKCTDLPLQKILELIGSGLRIDDIAKELGVSTECVRKCLKKNNLSYRALKKVNNHVSQLRRNPELIALTIMRFLKKLGRNYSINFKEDLRRYDPELLRIWTPFIHKILELASKTSKEIKYFKMRYISTAGFKAFPQKLLYSYVVYIAGNECEVIKELSKHLRPKTPLTTLKHILKINNAPEELLENTWYIRCLERKDK